MNHEDKAKYWKRKALKWKKLYNHINKYNVVIDEFEDVPKELVKQDEEIISFKLTNLTHKHERKQGIKSNPYDYNALIKAKSKSLFVKGCKRLKEWYLKPVSLKGKVLRVLLIAIKLLLVLEFVVISPEVYRYIEVLLAFV